MVSQILSTFDFTGAQASGANIDMFRSTVYNSFNSFDVGLPSSVASSVRVGNLNAESNIFSADFTFCHAVTPPLVLYKSAMYILTHHF